MIVRRLPAARASSFSSRSRRRRFSCSAGGKSRKDLELRKRRARSASDLPAISFWRCSRRFAGPAAPRAIVAQNTSGTAQSALRESRRLFLTLVIMFGKCPLGLQFLEKLDVADFAVLVEIADDVEIGI